MKFIKPDHRHFLSATIIAFYFIPLIFFILYSREWMAREKSWALLSFGLLLVTFGSCFLTLILYYWEQTLRQHFKQQKQEASDKLLVFPSEKEPKVTSLGTVCLSNSNPEEFKEPNLLETTLTKQQEEQNKLLEEMQSKTQENHQLEEKNKQLQTQVEYVTQDFNDYKIFSEEQLKQKNLQILTFQHAIEEQKMEMDRKQQSIQQLTIKVHDLSYEIKTLLHLQESESKEISMKKGNTHKKNFPKQLGEISTTISSSLAAQNREEEVLPYLEKQICTSQEASLLLKRCTQIAQRLPGAHYYGADPSHYAIDQRHLFDSLRNENSGVIFVYSQQENKLLFVNHQIKQVLGWSSEKFTCDFPHLIQEGLEEWKTALNKLSTSYETQTRLMIKSKQGQEVLLQCHLKVIPTGLFKSYILGVLYPT
jgi:hypothetical protein